MSKRPQDFDDEQTAFLNSVIQAAQNMPGPATGADPYTTALSDFAIPGVSFGDERNRIPIDTSPFQESESGSFLKFPNGVIVDQINNTLLPGPWMADPEVEGSNAWLRAIQEKWDDKTFDKWRKRLIGMGYDQAISGGIAATGGAAQDVIEGLRLFHQQRYLNGGTPLRFAPELKPESIRKQVDFAAVRETVGTWLDAVGLEDDDAKEFLSQQMVGGMVELARKNPTWTMEQVQSGAELRAQQKFVKQPGIKQELQTMEEDEMDETLREDAISIMELGIF